MKEVGNESAALPINKFCSSPEQNPSANVARMKPFGPRPSGGFNVPTPLRKKLLPAPASGNRSGLKAALFTLVATSLFGFSIPAQENLPGTQPLQTQTDLSADMVAGIDNYLMRAIDESVAGREKFWKRDFSSREAYEKSVAPNRERLRKIIGAVDERTPFDTLEFVSDEKLPAKIAEATGYEIFSVRWPVFDGVFGEGLWLKQKKNPRAFVVAIPDADQTPEMIIGLGPGVKPDLQFARRLAENGCEVLVPTLLSRSDDFSGSAKRNRFTNQPHREWIYRQSYELGRHVIGYEVQKILAAVDWQSRKSDLKIGVAGYGEGGLLALASAAIDPRINSVLVSGYFQSREKIWEEPIYRNVSSLLREFGDAEIATLIAPRALIVEHGLSPTSDGPPKPRDGRNGAAPGKLSTPEFDAVENEVNRAKTLLKNGGSNFDHISLISGNEGMLTGPVGEKALTKFLQELGLKIEQLKESGAVPGDGRKVFSPDERQKKQVEELANFTQTLVRDSERTRGDSFWKRMKPESPEMWEKLNAGMRQLFWEQVIGRLPDSTMPLNPRSRKILDEEKFTGYDVVLDVQPDVFAWGVLLLPKDLKPGEKRPVVVCQHGLEGVPMDTITEDEKAQPFPYYKGFSAQLAKQGFIVFAPHNPYRGGDKFRVLQRKANPLGLSLFSFIIAQHNRILDWLSEQPFVDSKRIAFYGLSYGGKTAMRVPAVIDRYCLSICSGDFNEWIRKNASLNYPSSYMFTGEYEMPEFNLGQTFNYAEMAALIAPRPFMVERGHSDGVGVDEWVAYEYAKVRRLYDTLGIGERTTIEYFNGPHTIHGVGTFEFLHKNLNWPAR